MKRSLSLLAALTIGCSTTTFAQSVDDLDAENGVLGRKFGMPTSGFSHCQLVEKSPDDRVKVLLDTAPQGEAYGQRPVRVAYLFFDNRLIRATVFFPNQEALAKARVVIEERYGSTDTQMRGGLASLRTEQNPDGDLPYVEITSIPLFHAYRAWR